MMVVFCGGKGSWCLHTEDVRHEIYDVIHLLTHPLTMYGGLVRLCSHGPKSAPPMVCWRAGASQPSRPTGTIFLFNIYIRR